VTQLQVTACVFGLPYVFHLLAKDLTVCAFSGSFLYDLPFCCYTRLLTDPSYFRNFNDNANTVARCFYHLVPNDNFHCQTPLKNAKFDLFGSENTSWQIWLSIEIGNCDSPTGYDMHFPAILSNYNDITA